MLYTVKIPNTIFHPTTFLVEVGILQNMTWDNANIQTEDDRTELRFYEEVWFAVELVFQRMYKKDINEFVI